MKKLKETLDQECTNPRPELKVMLGLQGIRNINTSSEGRGIESLQVQEQSTGPS